ncbi:MAG: hypothetical protein K6F52_03190 [Clostridia bacterium]|nr:hypothetical protein [Clostridia bacterium]
MRRKASPDKGFLISMLINMAFRFEWVIAAAALAAAHFFLDWPWWLPLVPLAIWFLQAFIVTAMLSFALRLGNSPQKSVPQNKNPYSKSMDSDGNLK